MAYTKTTWVSGETPLSADNMNNIEDGIIGIDNNTLKFPSNTRIQLTNLVDRGVFTAPKSGWLVVQCSAVGDPLEPYLEISCSGLGVLNCAWGITNNTVGFRCVAPVKEGVDYYIHFSRCTFTDAYIYY